MDINKEEKYHSFRTITFLDVHVAEVFEDRCSKIDHKFSVEFETMASSVLFVDAATVPKKPAPTPQRRIENFISVAIRTRFGELNWRIARFGYWMVLARRARVFIFRESCTLNLSSVWHASDRVLESLSRCS